jgi:hypothetical protein
MSVVRTLSVQFSILFTRRRERYICPLHLKERKKAFRSLLSGNGWPAEASRSVQNVIHPFIHPSFWFGAFSSSSRRFRGLALTIAGTFLPWSSKVHISRKGLGRILRMLLSCPTAHYSYACKKIDHLHLDNILGLYP